jgi:ubiquitin
MEKKQLTKKEKHSLKKLIESRKKSIIYCSKTH